MVKASHLLFFALILNGFYIGSVSAAEKVIVVHVRGGAFEQIKHHIETGGAGEYLRASYISKRLGPLTPITNGVTISNIATFETGRFPSEHGIVGHTFGSPDNEFAAPVSGFSKEFAVETFWEKAAAAGKQVLNVGALIGHGKSRNHRNVNRWAQGVPIDGAQMLSLPKSTETKTVSLSDDFKIAVRRGETGVQLIIDEVDKARNRHLGVLEPGNWLEFQTGLEDGLRKVQRLHWINDDQLFIRPSFVNQGAPKEFLADVDQNVGGSVGWPSIPQFSAGEIAENTIVDEINHELDMIMDVFSYASGKQDYDLIMIDYPVMDRYGHGFLSLKNSGPDMVQKQFQTIFQVAHERLSRDLATIAEYAEGKDYKLIVASGHGFSPIHAAININRFLDEGGFNADGAWQVRGFPGKVSAHLYANPELSEANRSQVLTSVAEHFNALKDLKSGDAIVDRVFLPKELREIGMDHSRSGDLFVMLKPGYIFQPQFRSERPVFDAPVFKGDHGYAPNHAESLGFVISDDPNIKHVVDVAGYIERLMSLEEPN